MTTGRVVLVDFYSGGATMAKSGTQEATFIRALYTSIDKFSETWLTLRIASTAKTLPPGLPYERGAEAKVEIKAKVHL